MAALFLFATSLFGNLKRIGFFLSKATYKFRGQDWPKEWIFSGRPEQIGPSELLIKWSRAGCLLKNYYWKNFKMTCEVKFLDIFDKTIGFVFLAENLDNYFMLELSAKHNQIKPHVRYRGGWDIVEPTEKRFVGDGYFGVVLELKSSVAYLYIDGSLSFTWNLPTHVDVVYRESGVNSNTESSTEREDDKPNGRKVAEHVQKIPFSNNGGMIGFRAHPGQGAIVRGLTISPL